MGLPAPGVSQFIIFSNYNLENEDFSKFYYVPDSKGIPAEVEEGGKELDLEKLKEQEEGRYKPSVFKLMKAKDAGPTLKDQIH